MQQGHGSRTACKEQVSPDPDLLMLAWPALARCTIGEKCLPPGMSVLCCHGAFEEEHGKHFLSWLEGLVNVLNVSSQLEFDLEMDWEAKRRRFAVQMRAQVCIK